MMKMFDYFARRDKKSFILLYHIELDAGYRVKSCIFGQQVKSYCFLKQFFPYR